MEKFNVISGPASLRGDASPAMGSSWDVKPKIREPLPEPAQAPEPSPTPAPEEDPSKKRRKNPYEITC